MKITLISPNILTQKGDLFGSGIAYMPVMLAYLAGFLQGKGFDVLVIDAFGECPLRIYERNNFIVQGLTPQEVAERIHKDCDAVGIYAESVVAHNIVLEMIKEIKKRREDVPVIIIENTQNVVAYSLEKVAGEFLEAGADYAVTGEPEIRMEKLLDYINRGLTGEVNIEGIIYKKEKSFKETEKIFNIQNFDEMPFPAWDLFPLENYWRLRYSHGPLSSEKYLPILTSRGCCFSCAFCVIPETNRRQWRSRSAKHVVDEIENNMKKYGVREFHIEDLNPTIDKKRIIEICKLISERGLDIKWKIVSGTKIETLDKETLEYMKKAGCRYISFSPESGSPRVLKLMNKPFDYEHSLKMAGYMHELGIFSQACFVLGFPGEEDEDLDLTLRFIKKMAKAGVDEIALFIMTPIPGAKTYGQISGYSSFEELTFSPSWRQDFPKLNYFRKKAYVLFFFWKFMYHPMKSLKSIYNILTRRFETKIEMTVYRITKTFLRIRI